MTIDRWLAIGDTQNLFLRVACRARSLIPGRRTRWPSLSGMTSSRSVT
jgi:hypothetical protein